MQYSYFRNIAISKIGYGTWPIGGDFYGTTNDYTSEEALDYAIRYGINFFDTADIYGNGKSERILGKVLNKYRDKVIISTKVGYVDYSSKTQDFSKAYINNAINASLKRLNTDYIDIYFLHSPKLNDIRNREAFDTLSQLKCKYKIRFTGISIRSPEECILALTSYDFDAIQIPLHLMNISMIEKGALELAREKKVCIIIKTPLCFGLLTNKYDRNARFPENDRRKNLQFISEDIWWERFYEIRSFCEQNNRKMSQFALKFLLELPGVTSVIPGMKDTSQVQDNLDTLVTRGLTQKEARFIKNNSSSL